MCDVSLKDRKRSEVLYSVLGIQSVAEVVKHGRLRWFGHVEMTGCRPVEMWRLYGREGGGQGQEDLENVKG